MPFVALRRLAVALVCLAVPTAAAAQSITPQQRGEIEKIVKDYLLANPEILEDVSEELSKRRAAAADEKAKAAIAKNADLIFNSPRGVVVGNREGDVNFVEFFDYNCGYCKQAMAEMLTLMKDDSKVRVVLKELPLLGPGSMEAAQVAIAVRMQDASGAKYLAFHQKLLGGRGQADKARSLAAAKEAGLDMARIEKDMASAEVRATIEENYALAEAMGINGTPSYVIGKDVIIGAVPIERMKKAVAQARCGKAVC